MATKKAKVDISKFQFVAETSYAVGKHPVDFLFGLAATAQLMKWFNIIDLSVPVIFTNSTKTPTLSELGEALGLTKGLIAILNKHHNRLKTYRIVRFVAIIPGMVMSLIFWWKLLFSPSFPLSLQPTIESAADFLASFLPEIVVIALMIIVILITFNLIVVFLSVLIGKIIMQPFDANFADTLTSFSAVCVSIIFAAENALTDRRAQDLLLKYIKDLTTGIGLLRRRRFMTIGTRERVSELLGGFENYIKEREIQIIASQKSTLEKLRRDFLRITEILISGQYGDISLLHVELLKKTPFSKSIFTWIRDHKKLLLRSIGYLVTLLLIFIQLYKPFMKIPESIRDALTWTFWIVLFISLDDLFGTKISFVQKIFPKFFSDFTSNKLTDNYPYTDEEVKNYDKAAIEEKQRRLRLLEQQAAHFGSLCPPHIIIEIEDLRKELKE